jgi:hypothetical protein
MVGGVIFRFAVVVMVLFGGGLVFFRGLLGGFGKFNGLDLEKLVGFMGLDFFLEGVLEIDY